MQQTLAVKLVNILFYVLMGIGAFLGVFFYIKPGSEDSLLYWTYVLLAISFVLIVLVSFMGMFNSKKSAISSLIYLAITAVLVIGAYSLSSSEMPTFFGVEAFTLTPTSLKWMDTALYLTYVLLGGSFIGLIYSEIYDAVN